MAIDFPNAPTNGDVYTVGSSSWVYSSAQGVWYVSNNSTVGDLTLTGGDLIVSGTTTFNLANTTATTLNIGGAATVVNLGAPSASLVLSSAAITGVSSLTTTGALGAVRTPYLTNDGNTGPYINLATTGAFVVNRTTTSNVALTVRGMAAQSGNLTEWQDSSSTVLAKIDSAGNFTAGDYIDWTTWSPTLAGITSAGSGATTTYRYCKRGKLVFCQVRIVFGTSPTFNAGVRISVTTPTTPASTFTSMFSGNIRVNVSGGTWYKGVVNVTSAGVADFYREIASTADTSIGDLHNTAPVTLAATSQLTAAFWYEEA